MLERIARQDKVEQVRRAAQRAIKQIRKRTEHNHGDIRTTLPRQV